MSSLSSFRLGLLVYQQLDLFKLLFKIQLLWTTRNIIMFDHQMNKPNDVIVQICFIRVSQFEPAAVNLKPEASVKMLVILF